HGASFGRAGGRAYARLNGPGPGNIVGDPTTRRRPMASAESQAAALGGFIARIEGEPQRAHVTFKLSAGLGGEGLTCEVPVRHHAVTVDEPKSIGGGDPGPNPVEVALPAA